MCAINGFFQTSILDADLQGKVFSIAAEIAKKSQSRGKDASGFSFIDSGNNLKYAKGPITSEELATSKEWNKMIEMSPKIFICHSRYGTKGTEFDNLNNHPLIIEENGNSEMALIHNGMISSDDTIRKEYPDLDWKAEVDTEVIPVLIQAHIKEIANGGEITKDIIQKAIKLSTPELSGNFACAVLNKNTPNTLYLFKHSNPIFLAYCKELKTMFFASTPEIINNAFSKALGTENIEENLEVFANFKMDYTLREMKEDEFFSFTNVGNGKVVLDQSEIKAKTVFVSGGRYGSQNWGVDNNWFGKEESEYYAEYSEGCFEGEDCQPGFRSKLKKKLHKTFGGSGK